MAKSRHRLELDWIDLFSDCHASAPPPDVEGIGACQRDTKPKCWKSSDLPEEVGSKITLTESNPQGKFEDKTDAAFSEELGFLCLDKWKRSGEIGLQLKEERRLPRQKSRHLVKISSREPPSVRYPKKDKQRSLSCKFADFIFPGISSSYSGKTLPRRLSKRRGASSQRSSMNLESDEHIVLLDDEDIHPVHSIESGDTSDDRQDYTIYYPSRDDPECVELSYSDLKCLENESYLSSPVMNFYIQYLQRSPCHMAKLKGDCYVFNTYFYSKLEAAITCKDDRTSTFLKLRRWWKGVDIFRKTYIFLPIHAESM